MTFEQLIVDNVGVFIAFAFGTGGFFYLVHNMFTRFDKSEEQIDQKFTALERRASQQQREIAALQSRVAAVEVVPQHLQRIETRVDDVWKSIMHQKGG